MKYYFYALLICGLLGYGISTAVENGKVKQARTELPVLKDAEYEILKALVPDSIKQLSHDASHTLMYAEPDGNDYWAARSGMRASSEWANENCALCRELRKMIEEREKVLNEQ